MIWLACLAVPRRPLLGSLVAPASAVVLNPLEKIDTPTVDLDPTVPSITLAEVDKLIAAKKLKNVDFLTGDNALATLVDGSKAYVATPQAETLLAKLRDAKIPYSASVYDLSGYAKPEKRDPATISPGAQFSAALIAEQKEKEAAR